MPIDPIAALVPVIGSAVILILAALALVRVARSHVVGIARVLWVLLLLFVPVVGTICWFLVGSGPQVEKGN